MQRVAVVGCIGAGKSTLGRLLARRLKLPVIHLDRLWWEPGSYKITGPESVAEHTLSDDEFRAVQEEIVARERWVIDGGRDNLDLRLRRADTIVFLDRSRWVCLWRILHRHNRGRDDYPNGVSESVGWLWRQVRWVWSYPTGKRPWFEERIREYGHDAQIYRLRTAADVRRFLDQAAWQDPLNNAGGTAGVLKDATASRNRPTLGWRLGSPCHPGGRVPHP